MRKSKFILLLTIMLVLGAGVVVGRLWAKLPVAVPQTDKKPANWVVKELNLTPDQQQQMDAIWGDTRQKMGAMFDKRRILDKERDQEIQDLLSSDQKVEYEAIQNQYRDGRSELDKTRDKLVKDAEERSRALLSDEQKAKWDSMPRGPRDHGPHGGPGSTNPSTRPSRQNRDRGFDH